MTGVVDASDVLAKLGDVSGGDVAHVLEVVVEVVEDLVAEWVDLPGECLHYVEVEVTKCKL